MSSGVLLQEARDLGECGHRYPFVGRPQPDALDREEVLEAGVINAVQWLTAVGPRLVEELPPVADHVADPGRRHAGPLLDLRHLHRLPYGRENPQHRLIDALETVLV